MQRLESDSDQILGDPWRQHSTVELMRAMAEKTSALAVEQLELARKELG